MHKVIATKIAGFHCHTNKSEKKNHSMNKSKDLRDKGKVR